MARSFSIKPTRIVGFKDGESFFDTRTYPVQFYPAGEVITVTGQTISFPDYHKTNAYAFAGGMIGSDFYQSCHSLVSIPFQEWGPSDQPGMTDDLPDEVIGTVPEYTDLLMVRVKLSRTNSPDQVNGNTVPVAFHENEWVMCDGGTLLVEYLQPIVRMIWIRRAETPNLDGTYNVLLTRKQSVKKTRYSFWRAGNNASQPGWTYGGTNGEYGHLVKSIQQKGPSFSPGGVATFRRGDGGQCSLTDASDYSSEFQGDIEILPGRSNITPESTGGASGGTSYVLTDVDSLESNTTPHVYNDKYIGEEPAIGDTRHVVVHITAYKSLVSGAHDITGVTLNGDAMTELIKQRSFFDNVGSNDISYVDAFYILEVPTGNAGDISIAYTAAFWWSQIDVYAVTNLPSETPLDTWATGTSSASKTLVTGPFGVAFAGNLSDLGDNTLTGIANLVEEEVVITSPSARAFSRMRADQTTDGTSLPLDLTVLVRQATTAVSLPGVPPKSYVFTDQDMSQPSSSTHTYADKALGDVPATGHTRHIMVAMTCFGGAPAANTSLNVTGMTINGVAATQKVISRYVHAPGAPSSNSFYISAVYIAEVPTDATGDIVISYNGTMTLSTIDVFAAYNLDSTTADDTIIGTWAAGGGGDLATAPRGFAIGVLLYGTIASTPTFTGLANLSIEQILATGLQRAVAYENSTGVDFTVSFPTTFQGVCCWVSFH